MVDTLILIIGPVIMSVSWRLLRCIIFSGHNTSCARYRLIVHFVIYLHWSLIQHFPLRYFGPAFSDSVLSVGRRWSVKVTVIPYSLDCRISDGLNIVAPSFSSLRSPRLVSMNPSKIFFCLWPWSQRWISK